MLVHVFTLALPRKVVKPSCPPRKQKVIERENMRVLGFSCPLYLFIELCKSGSLFSVTSA